jgi:hypothetical protein
MSRTFDNEKKSSQSTTSVKPTATYLQTRGFAPIQTDLDENATFRPSGYTENFLEKIINQPSTNSSGTPVQRKPQNRLKAISSQRMAIQAKLNIGEPNDKYEQEADATASKVVQQINSTPQDQSVQKQESMEEDNNLQMKPISSIQRDESMEEDDEELQTKSLVQRRENLGGEEASTDLESSIQSARGSGQSLDPSLQTKMGEAMGADFSSVKVHTDSQSDQLNQSIQAKAFTTGQDVFFRQGAYDPSSQSGQELIAHELTHVVQQSPASSIRRKITGKSNQSHSLNPSNSSQPLIQRFYADRPPIPFHTATQASLSGKGGTGVVFVKDITNKPVVVKANKDDVGETLLSSALHQEASGTGTPFTRTAQGNEQEGIVNVLSNVVNWNKEAVKKGIDPNTEPEQVENLKNSIVNQFTREPNLFIMGLAQGKDFGDIVKEDPNNAGALLQDASYLQQLGRIHAVDAFLGNGDRLEMGNLGNWMTNGDNQISLIDNYDANSNETLLKSGASTEFLASLAPSKQRATATHVTRRLEVMSEHGGMPKGWFTQERKLIMIDNIEIGIAAGRAMLIQKLTPKFRQKRSRTLKAETMRGGGKQLWKKVKARAAALKALK